MRQDDKGKEGGLRHDVQEDAARPQYWVALARLVVALDDALLQTS